MVNTVMRRLALPFVLMLALVACNGGAAQDPKDQLIDALRALGDLPGMTISISLDTDQASLDALTAEEPMPTEVMQMILGGAIRVSVPTDPEAKAAEFALSINGTDHVAMRMVGDTLYLRADVRAIMEAVGEDPAELEGFAAMLTGSGMLPPDVLEGRWIAIRGAEDLAKQFLGDEETPSPLDQVKMREAMDRLANVLIDHADITRVGSDSNGDHLRAVAPMRSMYTAIKEEIDVLGIPGLTTEDMPAIEEVPDESITVDLWIDDGRLAAVAIDLIQFAAMDPEAEEIPEGVERLGLRMTFEPFDGNVAEPDDAFDFNPMQLLQMFMGAMGDMGDAMGEAMGSEGMPPGFGDMGPGEMPPGFEEFMDQYDDGSS